MRGEADNWELLLAGQHALYIQIGTFGVFGGRSCGSDLRLRCERAQGRAESEGRARTAEQLLMRVEKGRWIVPPLEC